MSQTGAAAPNAPVKNQAGRGSVEIAAPLVHYGAGQATQTIVLS